MNSRLQHGGFTLIELLVSFSIVGVLAALTVPAVQYAREAARRTKCRHNLREMGTALLAFHARHERFPAGRDGFGARNHSWATRVLPFLEEVVLEHRYDFQKPWDDESPGHNNRSVAQRDLSVFQCPSSTADWPGRTDYGGNSGSALTGLKPGFQLGEAWESGVLVAIRLGRGSNFRRRPVGIAEVTDGTSHTFLVLEDAGRSPLEGGVWANGLQCFAHDRGPINSHRSNEIYSEHAWGAHALMTDGSVRFLSEDMALRVIGMLSTRNVGEVKPQRVK